MFLISIDVILTKKPNAFQARGASGVTEHPETSFVFTASLLASFHGMMIEVSTSLDRLHVCLGRSYFHILLRIKINCIARNLVPSQGVSN